MIEVSGKTAGIIGLGRIGTNTAKILKAMNMNVLAYDGISTKPGRAVAEYVELDELLAKSDFGSSCTAAVPVQHRNHQQG